MILKASRYSLPIAKIRTSLGDLLGAREYAMLLHAPRLDDMMAALRTTAYGPALRTADVSFATAVRRFRLSKAERLIRALPPGALALCRTFLSRFELEALKVILRALVSGTERRRTLSMLQPMPARSVLPIEGLLAARTLEEAAKTLAGTPYAEPLTEGLKSAAEEAVGTNNAPPLSEVEAHLDRSFLIRMSRASDMFAGEERAILRRLLGVLIDVINVLWTQRLRKTFHLPPEAAVRRLCPAGFYFDNANKRETLAHWDGEGQPPFIAVGLEEAGGPLRVSLMRMLAREARRPLFAIPFQAGVALSYLVMGDLETADLVALYEGRRWGRDPMQLADTLIRFHGAALAGGEGA